MNKLLTLFFVLLFSSFVFSQTSKKSEIKKIDSYCKSVDSFVKKHKSPQLIFADVSQTEKEKWRKFQSEKALEKFREDTETYSISYNWLKKKKIIFASFTFFSESGDWFHYIDYYFHPDGSLAKIDADLKTFYGNLSALRTLYFDKNGKLLRKSSKFYSIYTKKEIKPDRAFIDEEIYIYKKLSQLPFATLLKN